MIGSMPTIPAPTSMLERAKSLRAGIVSYRQRIHANPELGFQEFETAKLIAKTMRSFGYEVRESVGGTGVVADLKSPDWKGPIVAIRADMDALPIIESNQCEYVSRTSGIMHACGHDAHVACALGAAKLLADAIQTKEIEIGLRFLFQPAEETVNADGKSGATLMMEQGALEGVSSLIALHVFPSVPTGMVAIREEYLLAACDSFTIKITGRGCHGAFPEQGIDPIVISTQVVQMMQTLVARRKPANDAAILTIGGIRSSSFAPNVVPESVELTGTVRYFRPEIHDVFRVEIERICSFVESMGGKFELDYHYDTPALWNDPRVTAIVRETATKLLGESSVLNVGPQLGADDFSFYTAKVPSCYFVLGVARNDRATDLHSPHFDLNEDALPFGAAMLAESARSLCNVRFE